MAEWTPENQNNREPQGSGYPDRSEKVRNFHVHIDDDVGIGDLSYTKDQPVYKGEVYFSNHSRRAPDGTPQQARPVQQRSAQPSARQTQQARPAQQTGRTAQKPASGQSTKKKKKKKKHGYLTATAKVLISVLLCTSLLSGIGISTVNDILAINRSAEPVARYRAAGSSCDGAGCECCRV